MLFLSLRAVDLAGLLTNFLLGLDCDLRVGQLAVNFGTRYVVHILHVAAQVAALSERLVALGALERSDSGMLAEVVPEIAALLEDAVAALVLALEE